jgi:uncharacterized protein (TIGR02757 family)
VNEELKIFLEEKYRQYNQLSFISSDPISIPHQFSRKEDIEISGFFAATLAWGQRITIIRNSTRLMHLMDNSPYDFIMNFKERDLENFKGFAHRTFNYSDLCTFFYALKNIYQMHKGIESVFNEGIKKGGMDLAIAYFREKFLEISSSSRSSKHISNPLWGSAAKRINMYLRWLVRKDKSGVDFGLWQKIRPDQLICPLDVHSGRVARKLGLLSRSRDDWKAAEELTNNLRLFDAEDPVKYDFALFGLGVFEKF